MTDPTGRERPEWIPDGFQWVVLDDGTYEITAGRTELNFGRIPIDTHVSVVGAAQQDNAAIGADEVGAGSRLILRRPGTRLITVGSEFERIDVAAPHQGVRLRLAGGRNSLHLEAGQHRVTSQDPTSPAKFRVVAEQTETSGPITLIPEAQLGRVSGTGEVTVHGTVNDEVRLTGSLTVRDAITGDVHLAGDGARLVAGAIESGCSITAHSVTVKATSGSTTTAVNGPVTIVTDILDVDRSIDGSEDHPAQLTIHETLIIRGDVHHCHIRARGDADDEMATMGQITVTGQARDVVCEPHVEHVKVSGPVLAPFIVRASVVDLKDRVDGEVEITATDRLTVSKNVNGAVRLEGGSVTVMGEVTGTDEQPATLLGTSTVHVHGSVAHTNVRVFGTGSEDHQPAVLLAAKSATQVRSEATINDARVELADFQVAKTGKTVQNVLVVSTGHVHLGASATDADVESMGLLAVAGDLAVTRHQPPDEWPEPTSQLADQVLTQGTLTLPPDEPRDVRIASVQHLHGPLKVKELFVAGRTTEAHVDAPTLGIAGEVASSTLTAHDHLLVDGEVDAASSVIVNGAGSIRGDCHSPVTWHASPDTALTCHGQVQEVEVIGPAEVDGNWPELTSGPFPVERLTVSNHVAFSPPSPEKNAQEDGKAAAKALTLEDGATLKWNADTGRALHDTTLQGKATIIKKGRARSTLIVKPSASDHELTFTVDEGICDLRSSDDGHGGPSDEQPAIRITRGTIQLLGHFRRMTAASDSAAEIPTLNVPEDTSVWSLAGRFRSSLLRGRVTGPETSPSYLRRHYGPDNGRYGPAWWKGQTLAATPQHTPAKLVSLGRAGTTDNETETTGTTTTGGQLVGIDVSGLPYDGVKELAGLHVFAPDGATLMAGASAKLEHDWDVHDRAQRYQLIAETVAKTSAAGSTRAAAKWAATRSHHAQVGRGEAALRWIHRAFGYGQRPLAALATLVMVVLLVATALQVFDADPNPLVTPSPDPIGQNAEPYHACGDDYAESPYRWSTQIARTILLPVTLLRLTGAGGGQYAPIACSTLWQLAGVVLVGLPAVFVIVALRNFMRSPADA